ncbi:MAG: hypothetical protein FIB08_03850 [Candidatus Methanoperedens sp.]|nr:hypothetical protein [Candidatus Methanoperedens sp.]
MEEKTVLSETRAQIKEEETNRQTAITSLSLALINNRGSCESQMAFDTLEDSNVWGLESLYTGSDNRCGECRWFDPACDICYFFGTARVDDLSCESFHPAE